LIVRISKGTAVIFAGLPKNRTSSDNFWARAIYLNVKPVGAQSSQAA